MTVLQIIQNVYEGLGEPSDLQYLDDNDNVLTASIGWHRMVDAVNTAALELSTWKFPDGRVVRFRFLEAVADLETLFQNATIVSAVTNSAIIQTTLTNTTTNFYSGCAIKLGSAMYRVRYSQASVAVPTQVDLMLDTNVTTTAGAAFTLSKREYLFTPQVASPFTAMPVGIAYNTTAGVPLEITNVYDMLTNSELDLIKKYDPMIAMQVSFQTPSEFYKLANGIRFDVFPDTQRRYAIRYMRGPALLDYVNTSAEPELPKQFHQAIVLHCLLWGYRRMQENNSAYSTKQDLNDMLRRIRTEYDFQGELTAHQITVDFGE